MFFEFSRPKAPRTAIEKDTRIAVLEDVHVLLRKTLAKEKALAAQLPRLQVREIKLLHDWHTESLDASTSLSLARADASRYFRADSLLTELDNLYAQLQEHAPFSFSVSKAVDSVHVFIRKLAKRFSDRAVLDDYFHPDFHRVCRTEGGPGFLLLKAHRLVRVNEPELLLFFQDKAEGLHDRLAIREEVSNRLHSSWNLAKVRDFVVSNRRAQMDQLAGQIRWLEQQPVRDPNGA